MAREARRSSWSSREPASIGAVRMSQSAQHRSSPLTGVRVTVLILAWLGVVLALAPRAGLYYEALAAWLALPPLGLVYAYCVSHPRRDSAVLAAAATAVAALVIALALLIPHAAAV